MTKKQVHEAAGKPSGGQFAKTTHGESAVALSPEQQRQQELFAERDRPLTVRDIEGLRSVHGTYEPGENYYLRMPKVFDAAMEKAIATPEGRREIALREKAEYLHDILGLSPKDIRDFHDEISQVEPGTEGWENILQTYCEHYFNEPRGTGVYIESQMREAGITPAIGEEATGPAPVLDGFTAAEVEDYLAREQHERQCACDLVDDICCTESYGEHWRHRMGVPDVEGIFEPIQEMAAARGAAK